MASTYLSKTYGSDGNRKTMTFSFWIKRGNLSTAQYPMSIFDSGSGNQADMRFAATTDVFRMYATGTDATPRVHLVTDRVFRDTSAWYHIVWEIDTTQATASDRVKLYVNGVQETSFSTEDYPPQNTDLRWNGTSGSTGGVNQIGAINGGNFIDGYMAHFHFIDGTAYDASTFGETDATTGIWKPKTAPSVTYGTNGFFLKFENSAAFGTDSSGNSNNWTVNGTMTQTIDTPSNVFATLSPLHKTPTGQTLSNGNLTATNSVSNLRYNNCSTICSSSGKYYAEVKIDTIGGETGSTIIGFLNVDKAVTFQTATDFYNGQDNFSAGWYSDNGAVFYQTASTWQTLNSFTTGDILQFAMDLDNGFFYFGKNGTWQNSADPTSGATGTGGLAVSGLGSSGDTFGFSSTVRNNGIYSWNFGNGYFGTTAVSSAQNPDDGIGIFEYAVPTGYKALCTKSINAQEYD